MTLNYKPRFYFDYVYYRLTKFYFKWDGSSGITALIAITMIQVCLIGDIIGLLIVLIFNNRKELENYPIEYLVPILVIGFLIRNYFRFDGQYKYLRDYWSAEDDNIKLLKNLLVIISIILPWVPMLLIGAYWKVAG